VSIAAAALLAVLLPPALWWGPSAALRFALTRGLEAQGIKVAALDDAVFSLTRGQIDLRRLDMRPPMGPPFIVDHIDVSFAWKPLFAGRVDILEVTVDGFELRVERDKDRRWLLPFPSGETVPVADAAAAVAAPPSASSPFPLGIARLTAKAGRVTLADADGKTLPVVVEKFDVSDFALADGERPLRLEIDVKIAGGTLRAKGTATPMANVPGAKFDIAIADLDLGAIAPFADVAMAGRLRAETSIDAKFDGATLDGTLSLANGDLPGIVSARALDWRGKLAWSPKDGLAATGAANAADLVLDGAKAGTIAAGAIDFRLAADDTWRAAVTGAIGALEVNLPDAQLGAQAATLTDIVVESKAGGVIAVQGKAKGESLRVVAGENRARLDAFDATLTQAGFGKAIDAAFDVQATRLSVEAPAGRATLDALRVAGTYMQGDFDGKVEIDNADAETAEFAAKIARAAIQGRYANGDFTGPVSLDGLEARHKAEKITITAAGIGGNVSIAPERPRFAAQQLRLRELAAWRDDGMDLFQAASISFDRFTYADAALRIRALAVERMKALRRETAMGEIAAFPWRFEAARVDVGGANLEPDTILRFGTVRARAPVLRVTRTAKGLASFEALAAGDADPDAPAPAIRVARVEIDDARLEFEDRAIKTPVYLDASRVAIRVGALDTRAVDRPTPVSLKGRVGGYGEISLEGTAMPLAAKRGFDLKGKALGIDLPPISPYVADALGVELRTGNFDLDLTLAAKEEALTGVSNWHIRNLEIDERGSTRLSEETGVPIALALSLLRDSAGDIALDIPISGKLNDPSFDTSGAVRQAVGGAMRGAIAGTFNVLFPFGMVFGALLEGGGGPEIALAPVAFAAGKSALDDATATALDRLADALAARPTLRMEICGFAGPDDLRALNAADGTDAQGQKLIEGIQNLIARASGAPPPVPGESDLRRLAEARMRAVKDRLIAREGVAANRLFECRPVVESAAEAKPRVELKF
jgi:uncharacterized protein involved in outer membrane biogenesis/outer membrane protein OmpA-like peptidoglycan-associated protein